MTATPLKVCKNCGRQFNSHQDFLVNTSRWRICDQGHLWFNCQCNSTGMILKGRHDWYDPNAQLSSGAKSIFNQLPNIKEIPHISNFVMELQTMVEDENISALQLADVTKRDPLLAAQILKVANQQAPDTVIKSLAHAISYVGIETFKEFILIAAISSIKLSTKAFNAEQFWEHSFLIGRCSEYLVQRFGLTQEADHAYIAGCTCNIGKIVLALCLPQLADRFTNELKNLKVLGSWTHAETRLGAFQHTVLGEIGAMFWGLPDSISDAIAYHHRMPPAQLSPKPELYELVGFANQISHWLALQPHQINQPLFRAYCRRFQLNQLEAEALIEKMLPLRTAA